ncbi:MAG: Hsp70 family protein [Bacteroidota bacterium]
MTYCGLDFGTSNSLCTVEQNEGKGDITYITFEGHHRNIPSAVFYPDGELDSPLFGRAALDHYLEGKDGRLLRGFKRLLGTKYFSSGTMLTARNKLKFQDLFISFIQHVKRTAERQLDQEISHVVFGRPVRFSSLATAHKSGEQDLHHIAHQIGFQHVEFQFEPIASAFSHEKNVQKEKLAIVADIGGGTSDFSIVRLGPERKHLVDRTDDILANSGIALGGTDFDSMLALGQVMGEFGYLSKYGSKQLNLPNWPYVVASDWNKIALELYARQTYLSMKNLLPQAREPEKLQRFLQLIESRKGHHLLKLVEEAKIELSDKEAAVVDAFFLESTVHIPVHRALFDQAMGDKISQLTQTITEALLAAQLKVEDIDLIIMTGGASEVPIVQQTFLDIFPAAELSADNKLGSVCEGLLYDARRKFGKSRV